jgi:prepilin-type N-terminal cleavage/methylation domain-containing protein
MRTARLLNRSARGFSLIEMMATVVIVGILATVAVVGYKRWVRSAKVAEANSIITGIAAAQETYKAETGVYLNVSGTLDNLYPAQTPGAFKTEWGGPCSTCLTPWSRLSFQPHGAVTYGYATVASALAVPPDPGGVASGGGGGGGGAGGGGGGGGGGPPGGGPASGIFGGGTAPTSTPGGGSDDTGNPVYTPDPTGPFYTVVAKGDTNGDGVSTTVLFYSETRVMIVQNEGE